MAGQNQPDGKTIVLALRLTVDEDATAESIAEWLEEAAPYLRGDTGQIQHVNGAREMDDDEWAAIGGDLV